MRSINLANEKKRDAQGAFEPPAQKESISNKLPSGADPRGIKMLKGTPATDLGALLEAHGDQLGAALVQGNPEVDLEQTGMLLEQTRRVFVGEGNKIVYHVRNEEVVRASDGSEKERRPAKRNIANISVEIPLSWTGKMMLKEKVARMFVFSRKYQIRHVNGLTFDFLYDMAKKLDEANSLMFVGGGAKGSEPLVMSEGGKSYRAFMEGRIKDETYCLILHLTDLEMKEITK